MMKIWKKEPLLNLHTFRTLILTAESTHRRINLAVLKKMSTVLPHVL